MDVPLSRAAGEPRNHVDPDLVRTDIRACERCGGQHAQLPFRRFRHTAPAPFSHWALCPTAQEPILMIAEVRLVASNDVSPAVVS